MNHSIDAVHTVKECGRQLREARQAAGLSIEEVAKTLHMASSAVRALEQEDWRGFDAPVFVRGQLRTYAAFLGLNSATLLQQAGIGTIEPTKLVSHTHVPKTHLFFEALVRRAVYIVITAAFIIPVWFAANMHVNKTGVERTSLDPTPDDMRSRNRALAESQKVPSSAKEDVSSAAQQASVQTNDVSSAYPAAPYPFMASMAPVIGHWHDEVGDDRLPNPEPLVSDNGNASITPQTHEQHDAVTDNSSDNDITFKFNADSWFELASPDGHTLEKSLVHSGEQRHFPAGEVRHVVLGNADGVEVQHAGTDLDVRSFRKGNVARFFISPEGQAYTQ